VQADIAYTQNKIGATDLEISKLNIEIENTEGTITQNKAAIKMHTLMDLRGSIDKFQQRTKTIFFWSKAYIYRTGFRRNACRRF